MEANGFIFVGKILKLLVLSRLKEKLKFSLDFAVHFIDLRFNQPNFKAYELLELLLLEALAALAFNDLADEIEYLKLLTMMVIVSSCYHEKGVFQQSSVLDPRKFFRGHSPRLPILLSLDARCLAHPLFGSLRGPW